MAEECVALYKQSYSLEKEVSGHASPTLTLTLTLPQPQPCP